MIDMAKLKELKLRLGLAKSALEDSERYHTEAFARVEAAQDEIAKVYLEIDIFVDSYLGEE
jgi:hypothetical protein